MRGKEIDLNNRGENEKSALVAGNENSVFELA